MLEAIGRVGASSRQRNYQLVAQYSANYGRNLMPSDTSPLQRTSRKNDTLHSSGIGSSDAIETASIRSKLKEGQQLTTTEMDRLSEKNPNLHRQAQVAENARADLESQLAGCKTKDEARNALISALNRGVDRTARDDKDKQIIDNQASEASALEQMLTTLMTQIKTSLGASTEAGKTAEIAKSAKAIRADVTDATAAAMPLPPLKNTAPSDNDQDILETFLFKIRALQNAWDKYVHTQDYKAMPEGIAEAGKQQPDSRVMDMIKLYNPNKMQARVSAANNVDIVQ